MWCNYMPVCKPQIEYETATDIKAKLESVQETLDDWQELLKQFNKAKLNFKCTLYDLHRHVIYFIHKGNIVAKLTRNGLEKEKTATSGKMSRKMRRNIKISLEAEIIQLKKELQLLTKVEQQLEKITDPMKYATCIAKGTCMNCGNHLAVGFATICKGYTVILNCSRCEKNPVIKAMLLILEQL